MKVLASMLVLTVSPLTLPGILKVHKRSDTCLQKIFIPHFVTFLPFTSASVYSQDFLHQFHDANSEQSVETPNEFDIGDFY